VNDFDHRTGQTEYRRKKWGGVSPPACSTSSGRAGRRCGAAASQSPPKPPKPPSPRVRRQTRPSFPQNFYSLAGSDSPRPELLPTRTRSDLVGTLHGEWARTVYSLRTEELSSERAVGVIDDKMEDSPVTILSTKLVQGQEMKDLDSDSLVEQDVEIVIRDRARLYVDICRSRASR
jgi:hypothetical protein